MKKLMFAAAAGAALMWFYDPTSGSQRRETLQRKLNRGTPGPMTQPPTRIADLGERNDVARVASR